MKGNLVYKGKVSKVNLGLHILFASMLIGLPMLPKAIKRQRSFLEVYEKEVSAKKGMVRGESVSFLIQSIQSVSIDQGMLGKIFDYGTVTITTAGLDHISIEAISNPDKIRKTIHQLKASNLN